MPVPKSALSKPKKDDAFEIEMPSNSARVAKGKHAAKLISIEKETSKGSGNPMWTWTFVITEGASAGEEMKVWTALTPAAMWKVGEVLNALGLGTEPGEQVKFSRADAIGRGCVLSVVEDEYEGRPAAKVANVLPHPKGAGYKKKGGPVVEEVEDDLEDEEEEDGDDNDDLEDDDEEDEDEDDEEEEEEDDEEPEPVKKAPAKKAAAKAPPAKTTKRK